MPSVNVSYDPQVLNSAESSGPLIETPHGLSLLEIQGELNAPPQIDASQADAFPQDHLENYIIINEIHQGVKFGNLSFDANDSRKCTLLIGKSQRLIGSVVKLENPLLVLRLLHDPTQRDVSIVDTIYNKLIFKHRPLPIM